MPGPDELAQPETAEAGLRQASISESAGAGLTEAGLTEPAGASLTEAGLTEAGLTQASLSEAAGAGLIEAGLTQPRQTEAASDDSPVFFDQDPANLQMVPAGFFDLAPMSPAAEPETSSSQPEMPQPMAKAIVRRGGTRGEDLLDTPAAVHSLAPTGAGYRLRLDSKALSWIVVSPDNRTKRFGFGPRCGKTWSQALEEASDHSFTVAEASLSNRPSIDAVVSQIADEMSQLPERPYKYQRV